MTIKLPIKNFPAQQAVFDAPERFVIVPKGRRFGITTGAKNDFINCAIRHKFEKGLWGDVVNSNIEKYIERLFVPSLKNLPISKWKWTKNPSVLYIFDSYIDFRSAERPESWEGFGYDKMFLNEAGIILQNDYLWNHAIKPMMWDYKCRAVIGGTPKGQGEFHKLYQRGLDPLQPDYRSFKFSSFDNPHIPHQVIMDDMKTMTQAAISQEIYAEFLDDSGVVFRGVKEIATLPNASVEPIYNHLYVIGCDVAKLVDYTVIAVYDRTDNKQVFQMVFNNLSWPAIQGRIQHVSRKYNNALVYLDSTGIGEATYDGLTRVGIPVEPIHLTNESKKWIIEKLSNWIELKHFRMFDDERTIKEFQSFSYEINEKTKRFYYSAPVGFHDDTVIAHALAIWGMQPVLIKQPTEEMSIIQRDILAKKNNIPEDDYEEIDDWALYGNSDN